MPLCRDTGRCSWTCGCRRRRLHRCSWCGYTVAPGYGEIGATCPRLQPNQLFEELVAVGLAVATIDYRHALEARFVAQLHDAKAAIRYLRTHADVLGVDTARIGVWGESAGGHLAASVGRVS